MIIAGICYLQSSIAANSNASALNHQKSILASDALLGYVKMNLVDSPVPNLKVGQWNPRQPNPASIKAMVEDFSSGKCQPWLAPLILIGNQAEFNNHQKYFAGDEWTNPTSTLLDKLPPFLPLPNSQYKIAGGNHRITASRSAVESLLKRLENNKTKCTTITAAIHNAPDGDTNEIGKLSSAIGILEKDQKVLEEWIATAKVWPVQVFDDGLAFIFDFAASLILIYD